MTKFKRTLTERIINNETMHCLRNSEKVIIIGRN